MNCPGCGADFTPYRPGQKNCSARCYKRVRNRAERRQAKETDTDFERAHEEATKARAIQVMRDEPELEPWALVERFGVTMETLSRWRREAGIEAVQSSSGRGA